MTAKAEPLHVALFVTHNGYDSYMATLPPRALLDDDVVIAHRVNAPPGTN